MLKKKAGRVDSLHRSDHWSADEEKALLDFVKERKGDEMAVMGIFEGLEEAWQSKGFDTARTAMEMEFHQMR